MEKNKIFFDTNILMEVVEKRAHYKVAISELKSTATPYVSTLTIHIVMYFGIKILELKYLEKFVRDFELLHLSPEDVNWAFKNIRNSDFEDALQIALAIRSGCNVFVTFDKQLAKTYENLPTLKMKLLN